MRRCRRDSPLRSTNGFRKVRRRQMQRCAKERLVESGDGAVPTRRRGRWERSRRSWA